MNALLVAAFISLGLPLGCDARYAQDVDVLVSRAYIEWNETPDTMKIGERPPIGVPLRLVAVFVNNGEFSLRVNEVKGEAHRYDSPGSLYEDFTSMAVGLDVKPGAELTLDFPWHAPLLASDRLSADLIADIDIHIHFSTNDHLDHVRTLLTERIHFKVGAMTAVDGSSTLFFAIFIAVVTLALAALGASSWVDAWASGHRAGSRSARGKKRI